MNQEKTCYGWRCGGKGAKPQSVPEYMGAIKATAVAVRVTPQNCYLSVVFYLHFSRQPEIKTGTFASDRKVKHGGF